MELIAVAAAVGALAFAVLLYRELSREKAARLTLVAQHAAELDKARKAPAPTLTAEELLHDLTRGGSAVVRIERLNQADLLLRSPRS